MKYWITTHWPPREDLPPTHPPYGVWVQDKKEHLINRVSPGDPVFIYETRNGRTQVRDFANGSTQEIACRRGREGIIALVEVTGPAERLNDSHEERYTDGSKAWWRYCSPTRPINSGGFIPREFVNAALGYAKNNVLRGFGDEHSGLKEVTPGVFNNLLQLFTTSSKEHDRTEIVRSSRSRYGGGGEGPVHRALKDHIAADPETVLGEPGLTLYRKEFSFPTGDRIDVLLQDRFGRFVAVEVEVCCDIVELAGPLQCMKYRAMISYLFRRPLEEVRCFLVAHSIHDDICNRCSTHDIETKIISAKQG
jgi:hypothetical protein